MPRLRCGYSPMIFSPQRGYSRLERVAVHFFGDNAHGLALDAFSGRQIRFAQTETDAARQRAVGYLPYL